MNQELVLREVKSAYDRRTAPYSSGLTFVQQLEALKDGNFTLDEKRVYEQAEFHAREPRVHDAIVFNLDTATARHLDALRAEYIAIRALVIMETEPNRILDYISK